MYTETPMSPADHADNRRRTTKTTIISPPSQTVFLCEIMQLAAFSLRDLRHLRENIHISVLNLLHKKPPMSPADFADLRRQNPKPQQLHKL